MSENKKYYYLKFKENYFEQDHIKVIEAMKNGYEYSLIILKLYLKSLKWEGQLMINERIPYMADKIDILAGVLGHDPANVMHAVNLAKEMGIIDILNTGEIFISDIQNFIGHGSTEAERKAQYRKKIEENAKKLITNKSKKKGGQTKGQCPGQFPPELELELELELDKKTNKDIPDKSGYTLYKEIYNNHLLAIYNQDTINSLIFTKKYLGNLSKLLKSFSSLEQCSAFFDAAFADEFIKKNEYNPNIIYSQFEKIMLGLKRKKRVAPEELTNENRYFIGEPQPD